MLPKKLFQIQLEFATKYAELTGTSIGDSLLTHTCLYRIFYVPSEDFDSTQEIWQRYLEFNKEGNLLEQSYRFYIQRLVERNKINKPAFDGKSCFTYEIKGDYINIHFENREGEHPGPLSKERIDVRLKELKNVFVEIKKAHPDIRTVRGFSWLYNIHAYRRLFPKNYLKSGKVIFCEYSSFGIWGQFLDSGGKIRAEECSKFLTKVRRAMNPDQLYRSFPFYPIKVEGDIREFYKFYKV